MRETESAVFRIELVDTLERALAPCQTALVRSLPWASIPIPIRIARIAHVGTGGRNLSESLTRARGVDGKDVPQKIGGEKRKLHVNRKRI